MNTYSITPYIRYCVYRECPFGEWKIEPRTIPDHELVLMTGGRGSVTIESKAYPAVKGKMFYFYPGLLHSLMSDSEDPMSFYGMHFSYGRVDYSNNEWFVVNEENTLGLKTYFECSAYQKVEMLMNDICSEWNEKKPGHELICNGYFLQLIHQLLSFADSKKEYYGPVKKIRDIVEYIHENLHKKLTIRNIMSGYGSSQDHLTRLFREHTGFSPVRYINRCRIDKAKELLMDNEIKIKEVADLTGFNDEFYFSRLFKRQEGISPKNFRDKVSGGGK